MSDLRLGALDLCKLTKGRNHQQVIWDSVELAPRLENAGYSRYWLAEHHGSDVAHGSPELLVPVIAGVTRKIRVGTAGVLLRLYSPYKVAENFRLLHTLFPQRIDLGIARGFVHPERERALVAGTPEASFDDKVTQLVGYVRGTGRPVANPANTPVPEIWLLGSKTTSMRIAAELGTAFCHALFLDSGSRASVHELLDQYRSNFRPSVELKTPKWSIALAGICADTVDDARSLLPEGDPGVHCNVLGSAQMWRDELAALQDETGTTEFVILDLCSGVEQRARSYEMLAAALL